MSFQISIFVLPSKSLLIGNLKMQGMEQQPFAIYTILLIQKTLLST